MCVMTLELLMIPSVNLGQLRISSLTWCMLVESSPFLLTQLEHVLSLMIILSQSVVSKSIAKMYTSNICPIPSEPISVGYDPVSYVTTETAGFVDLTIRVFSHPGGSPRPFSLAINTEDSTASMLQIKFLM